MEKIDIVVIEDDHAIRDIIAYVLEVEGFEVITRDKLEPLEILIACPPQLIILDEWINEKAGSLLCHKIKAIHELVHVPVIIISTSFNIAQIAVSCKAEGYVQKPFDVDRLLGEIRRCLSIEKVQPAN